MMTSTTTNKAELFARIEAAEETIYECARELEATDDDALASWSLRVAAAFLGTAEFQLEGKFGTDHHRVSMAYSLLKIIQPDQQLDGEYDDLVTTLRLLTGDLAW